LRSIRQQLTVGLFVSLSALVLFCGAALYGVLRTMAIGEFDVALLAKAHALASLAELQPDGKVEFEFGLKFMPEFEPGPAAEYFEVRQGNGRSLARSRSLASQELPPQPGAFDRPLFWDLPLPDGRRGRAVGALFSLQFDPEDFEKLKGAALPTGEGLRLNLVMARSREALDRTLRVVLWAICAAGAILPLGIALIVWLLVKKGLRPLARVAAETAAIDSRNLQHRFAELEMPLELQPICRRLNDLLKRIEEAFARERRFTGDVAHELRTPIAELRSLSEVALMAPQDNRLAQNTVNEALAIARQMERLVAALLALARCEAGAQPVGCEPVDLSDAAAQAWLPFRDRALERKLFVSYGLNGPLVVQADRSMLMAVLGNLFSNAVDHSPAGGQIAIRTEIRGKTALLLIANTNATLVSEDLPHLFEPFWQQDASRSDPAHSGLGLSVVAAFCRLMNVEVSAKLAGDQLVIELAIPRAQRL